MEISIIIRTYNYAQFLSRAIESTLHQNFDKHRYEIIVVDDGSTDDTHKILEKYKNRIMIIRQKNQGYSRAANIGFRKAGGKYVILLDADDTFRLTILNTMYEKIKRASAKVAFVYSDYREGTGKHWKRISLEKNLFNCGAAGILFKRKIIQKLGYYDHRFIFPEYDLIIKIIKGGYEGKYIPEILFTRYLHGSSITSDSREVRKGLRQLEEKYGNKLVKTIRKY